MDDSMNTEMKLLTPWHHNLFLFDSPSPLIELFQNLIDFQHIEI